MSDDPYNVFYITPHPPEDIVKQVVERCRDVGFNIETDSTIAAIEEEGLVELSYDDPLDVTIYFNLSDEWKWNDPALLVSFATMPLETSVNVNPEEHTRERVQERVDAIIDLARELVTLCDPTYVWGMLAVGPNPDEGLRPTAKPISEHISRLSWLTVFSPSLIEELGGREHVLDTPAWKVEELATGHIMLVRSDNPVDPTVTPDASPEAYLLEGKDTQDPRDERGLSDPFERFEPGDLGADIVMDTDGSSGEPANEDISLVRCCVADDGTLREIESGAFVRRIIGEGGTPMGEVPADADLAAERVSVVMHPNVPESFVRLDHPDDENVITRLMALDVDLNKFELFVNFVSMAQEPTFDESDAETIEDTLAQLQELDDVDGVERLIERRLL